MNITSIHKVVLEDMTKAQEEKWKELQEKIKERGLDVITKEVSCGFLILEVFDRGETPVIVRRLDDPSPGRGNLLLRNFLKSIDKYFEDTIYKIL